MNTITDDALDAIMFADERTEIIRTLRAAMFRFLRSDYPQEDLRVLLALVGEFGVSQRV